MKKLHLLGTVCSLLLCFSASSNAIVIHWTLDNVLLDDGQSIIGGFDYDRDINEYSNISITNSGSTTISSELYTQVYDADSTLAIFQFRTPEIGDVIMLLNWGPEALTNDGGNFSLSSEIPVFLVCIDANCDNFPFTNPEVDIISGSLSSVPSVPIPPATWLFGSGLLGLIGMAGRKKA